MMKFSLSLLLAAATSINAFQPTRPNIVFIITDDQDLHMNSVDYMPLLKKYLIDHGTFFKRHYCSTALCCPSRVSLWTGRNAHNTNVTDVFPPYGGYPKFVSQGWNENWLPVWLQDAGYSTYYTGKLFNAHTIQNWNSPQPAGWTSSDFLLDPHTYQYLNATFQRNDEPPVSHEGEYSTDVLAEKAYRFLDDGVASGKPFFLVAAPIGPHSNVDPIIEHSDLDAVTFSAPIPAERHKHLFPEAKVPRTANFNPDTPSGASWISKLAKLNSTQIAYNDDFYRARLQTLQSVDELVEGLITRLEKYGILDNTYIIYTADNGYHISQHRLPPGKTCGFEEDINIPLVVRGPGVPVTEAEVVTAHTDLAPTILRIAEGELGWEGLDGRSIPLSGEELVEAEVTRSEHVNVEYWGKSIGEGKYHAFSLDDGRVIPYGPNNTYKAIRIHSKEFNLYYSVWCTNEHELYDLNTDPGQLHNLYPSHSSSSPSSFSTSSIPDSLPSLSRLLPRLDALLMVTKSCKGITCVEPWRVIHPAGNVRTLSDALNEKFDVFYASVAKRVAFTKCELGYVRESEGPQEAVVFSEWWLRGEEL